MKTKAAIEATSWGRPMVRGKTPMAAIIIEPRTRLTIPNCPSRLVKRFRRSPMAKIRLSTPVKINPELTSAVTEPFTPRTLISFSVQLNQGDFETANSRVARATNCEAIPQIPAIFLSKVPILISVGFSQMGGVIQQA